MNNIIKRVWNQNRMVNIEDLSGAAFQAESGGHTFAISGVDDTGAAVALSGTVAGVFRRPDNADIALTGASTGGVASVTLTDDCYAVPGRFYLTIFVTSGGQKTAVYAAVGTVASTNGGAVAGDTPQDVVDLINAIEAAVATIPEDYTDLEKATDDLENRNNFKFSIYASHETKTNNGVRYEYVSGDRWSVTRLNSSENTSRLWVFDEETFVHLKAGKKYKVDFSSSNSNISLVAYKYVGATVRTVPIIDGVVTIPNDATGFGFRIDTTSSFTGSATFDFAVYNISELTDLDRQVREVNAVDYLLLSDKGQTVDGGITYSRADNVYTITGNHGNSLWFDYLYNHDNVIPDWWVPGNRVYVQFDAIGSYGGALLQIYKYVGTALTLLFGTDHSTYYTIPSDFSGDGLLIRIRVAANRTVNFKARVGFLNTMPNDELAKTTLKRSFDHVVAFFGDSITFGRDGDGSSSDIVDDTIPKTVARSLAADIVNYGVSGMGFISNASSPTNAYGKITSTDLTAFDTAIMCFGVNDGFSPIGTWDSSDENTCLGQFNKIIAYLGANYPSIRIIVIAPFNGRNVGTFPKYWYGTVPSTAYSRGALSNALKQACEYYNIPYIEQKDGPINCYSIQTLIGTDGVHPNSKGYKALGAWLSGEIARLIG